MDAEMLAKLLGQAWRIHGQWRANQQRQDLVEEMRQLRAQIDALKVQATIQEITEIDILDQEFDKAGAKSTAIQDQERQAQINQAKAQRLRNLLVADIYNSQIRRLYLASRTPSEVRQDEEAGRKATRPVHIAAMIVGFIICGSIGCIAGAEYEQTSFLGIPTGSQMKSPNVGLGFFLALLGGVLGYSTKGSYQNRSEALWGQFGPIPEELSRKTEEMIRKKLFN